MLNTEQSSHKFVVAHVQCTTNEFHFFFSMQAGYTALNWAAKQGHSHTATILLKNGADIENADKEVCCTH